MRSGRRGVGWVGAAPRAEDHAVQSSSARVCHQCVRHARSDIHVSVRAWCRVGAGQKVGLEIWRVENRRTADDRPDFGVKRWPKDQYGQFYKGDSYIIMNTFLASPDAAKFSFGEGRSRVAAGTAVHFASH